MSRAWQSPLPFVGSKREAVHQLAFLVPADVQRLVSPFFGGGSLEFYLLASRRGLSIAASDGFKPLVNFWQCCLSHADAVARCVQSLCETCPSSETYWEWYQDLASREARVGGIRDAAVLFVLYKLAFNKMLPRGTTGVTLEQGVGWQSAVQVLRQFGRRAFLNRLSMQCRDAFGVIAEERDAFLFLDPPYLNDENLYGFDTRWGKDFEHARFACAVREHADAGGDFVLTYNDTHAVRELYGWARVETLTFPYQAARGTQRIGAILGREVVIRPAASVAIGELKAQKPPAVGFGERVDRFL